jgi:ubiquinone/menaquinone biosynthesis C-methylase UbiE
MYTETAHEFLSRLGKKILRPGGKRGTNFLLKYANINESSNILEVACNQGETLIKLYKKYKCNVVGVDNNEHFINLAQKNIKRKSLERQIGLLCCDAEKMPFMDNSFDIIITQAMLTMLSDEKFKLVLKEYFRILKPGGLLLTHDLVIYDDSLIDKLRDLTLVSVNPKHPKKWSELFTLNNFIVKNKLIGKMNLINPLGLLRNEGFNTFKILKNGLKKENKSRFKQLYSFFNKNRKKLGFICLINEKPR